MLKILIADDHEVVRERIGEVLAETLTRSRSMRRETTGNSDHGLEEWIRPGRTGPQDARKERIGSIEGDQTTPAEAARPDLSMHPEEQFAIRAMRAGASGYLTKECAGDELGPRDTESAERREIHQ